MSNILVRPMTVDDALGVAEVHVLSWQDTYRGKMPDELLDSLNIEDRRTRWKDMLENPKGGWEGVVAEKDDKIIGWSTFGPSRDENEPPDTAELWAIYVHPNFLGIGAGSLMMIEAMNRLKDMKYNKAKLWVLTTNEKSRNWYESKGWRADGATKTELRGEHELHETRYEIQL